MHEVCGAECQCVALLGADSDSVPRAASWVGKEKDLPVLMVPRATCDEFGSSVGEAHSSSVVRTSLLAGEGRSSVTRLEVCTVNAAACHGQCQRTENEMRAVGWMVQLQDSTPRQVKSVGILLFLVSPFRSALLLLEQLGASTV